MQHDEKLIDKIKAILRKADENANASEEERDTAMRMANRLLLKHGMEMADLGDIEDHGEMPGREWVHDRAGIDVTHGDKDVWKSVLLHRMAPTYFCKSYRIPLGKRDAYRLVLLGRSDHVAACKAMFDFVVPQLEAELNVALAKITRTSSPHQQQQARHARRYAEYAAIEYLRGNEEGSSLGDVSDDELARLGRERYEGIVEDASTEMALADIMAVCNVSMNFAKKVRAFVKRGDIAGAQIENLAVWRRSFFDGAIGRVATRLREAMRVEVKDLGEPGTALVKDENAALKEFMASLNLGLRSSTSNRSIDGAGHAAGDAAGKRADISGSRKVSGLGQRRLGA